MFVVDCGFTLGFFVEHALICGGGCGGFEVDSVVGLERVYEKCTYDIAAQGFELVLAVKEIIVLVAGTSAGVFNTGSVA